MVLGPEHVDTLASMTNLGNALRVSGQLEEAESQHRKTLQLRHDLVGSKHPDTLGSMTNLANVLQSMGQHEEARSAAPPHAAADAAGAEARTPSNSDEHGQPSRGA